MESGAGGMDIDINHTVISADGEHVGKVTMVIFDPDTNEATHIVVSRRMGRDIVIPISEVTHADNVGVFLHLTNDETQRMPDYVERDLASPGTEWEAPEGYNPQDREFPVSGYPAMGGSTSYAPRPIRERRNVPEGTIEIREGMSVDCDDGHIGEVDRVVVDEYTNSVTAIVIRRGRVLSKDVTVPIEWVFSMQDGRVKVSCTIEEIESLPESPASYG
jgi:uncharacterized protein YrrD